MKPCCYKPINRHSITKRALPTTEALVFKYWVQYECGICGNRMSGFQYIHISKDSDSPEKPNKRGNPPRGPRSGKKINNMGKTRRIPKDIWPEKGESKGYRYE